MTTISASESASRRDGDAAEAQADARGYSSEAASPSAAVRNIVLVGPAGAGKTSVLEALMFEAGALKRLGTIEHGDTVGDHDSISRDLGHSIDSTLSHLEAHGVHLNLIDTPGSMDFIGKSIAALSASDLVVIVVDTRTMHDPVLRRIARIAEDHNLPRMVVINKIDQGRDQRPLLANLGELFGPALRPIDLPNDHGHAVVDCFEGASGASDLGNVSSFHQRIIDQVVEVDDALMERYLSEGVLPPKPLHDAFEKALRSGHLVPLAFCSARECTGIKQLLADFITLAPCPTEGNPRPFEFPAGGSEPWRATCDPTLPLVAHTWKVAADPYVGRLATFRIHQGSIQRDAMIRIDGHKRAVRVAHLYRVQGRRLTEVEQLGAGDIGATSKIDEIRTGSILHDGRVPEGLHLKQLPIPTPMQGLAISAVAKGAEAKLGEALHKIALEDPAFRVDHVASTGETVIRGMGDLHLKVVIRMLAERFGVAVDSYPPRIPYREAITASAEGHCRHKKQTGGAGQFAEVFLRVEPLQTMPVDSTDELFELVDDTVGGSVPRQFFPAIEKGVKQAMEAGALAGYPMRAMRVSVYDGKTHAVDSKEIAFVAAGRKAFLEAVSKAKPVLLEPFVTLEITTPTDALGSIAADLSSRRGRIIETMQLPAETSVVRAHAPLAEVTTYANTLKSMTRGMGSFVMEYSHDDLAPTGVQRELIAQWKPKGGDEE